MNPPAQALLLHRGILEHLPVHTVGVRSEDADGRLEFSLRVLLLDGFGTVPRAAVDALRRVVVVLHSLNGDVYVAQFEWGLCDRCRPQFAWVLGPAMPQSGPSLPPRRPQPPHS